MSNMNPGNFEPTEPARQEYKEEGVSKSNYLVMKHRWLQQQAAKEGKEYRPGFVPKGYMKSWVQESALNPGSYYYKPDAYAKYRPDLPAALWDDNQEYQNYWHNPKNVVSWINRFRVQDEGYEPPEGIDKDFIEGQYEALKDFNDDEDDPLYWEPLPMGHEAGYAQNYYMNPDTGDVPIYRPIVEQLSREPEVARRLKQQYDAAAKEAETASIETERQNAETLSSINTNEDAQAVLDGLQVRVDKGEIAPENVSDVKAYFQQQGLIPLDDGTLSAKSAQQPEGGDYRELYPWQRGVQTIGSTAAMSNRPALSSGIADVIAATLPALGIYGLVSQGASIAAAAATTGVFSLTGAAAATAAITVAGLPVATVIGAGALLLGAGTALYILANKDNPNNGPVQKLFQVMNVGAEAVERGVGATEIAIANAIEGNPTDWRAAYDAGFVTYETHPYAGNFVLNLASWVSEGVDKLAGAVGIESNLSSGESAGANEVWLLDKGYKEPQQVEGGLGTPMLMSAYEAVKAMGDERNRDDMQLLWNYYTQLAGSGGTFTDFMVQSVADPLNFAQALGNKGVELAATKASKYYSSLPEPDVFRSTSFETLAQASRWAQGNPIIDAMPMGVQTLVEKMAQGFESKAEWKNLVKAGDPRSYADFKKSYVPSIHGTQSIADSMILAQSMLATGYMMPGGSEYVMHPSGNIYDPVRLQPFTDGSIKILNVNGSRVWDYSKAELDKLGVKFSKTETGELTITGMSALFKDAGIDYRLTPEKITTSFKADGLPEEKPIIWNPEGATITLDPNNENVFMANQGDLFFTIDRNTLEIKSVNNFGASTNVPDLKIGKYQWGEKPVVMGNDVMTHADMELMSDMITMTESRRMFGTNPDLKSKEDLRSVKLRQELRAKGLKNVDAAVELMQKFVELNPSSKAWAELSNLKEGVLFIHMTGGNNFDMTMRGIKKFVTGVDTGELTRAMETFLGQATTVVQTQEAMKVAFGDGSILDLTAQLYRDTQISRANIDKLAKEMDVTPHELLELTPEKILSKLKTKLIAKTDQVSRMLAEQIANGSLSEDALTKLMAPYRGENALPLTDQDFLATVTMAAEKATQDYLVNKYGIKKLPTLVRLSGAKKAMVSPFLISFPYTTWMNNLWSNLGAQGLLEGVISLQGKTAKDKLIERIGLDALPWAPSERMGLASDMLVATSKIQLLMNPNDSIGKVTRAFTNLGGIVKAYSKIEEFNTTSLFLAEVMNLHRRIRLPDMPVNITQRFIAEGTSPETIKLIQTLFNGTMSPEELTNVLRSGAEYNAIDVGAIEDAAGILSKGAPDRTAIYTELLKKLGADDEFMKVVRTITNPEELYLIRDALEDGIHRQIAVMMDESVRSHKFEVQNIMTKEGMAGGIKLMSDAIYGELETRYKNSVAWGEAKAAADAAKDVADYATSNRIIRAQRERSNKHFTYFYALQDTQMKAMVDILKAGDADSKAFLDLLVKRHELSRKTMVQIDKNYSAYFDAETNGTAAKWDAVVKNNESLMETLDKAEMETMTQVAALWTKMLGSKVAEEVSASGVTAKDLRAGGESMMKRLIKGYEELNKLRAQHYKDLEGMPGNDRRAAQMTFWNEVWKPKTAELMAYFTDENWNKFYKTKTKLEKKLYPAPADKPTSGKKTTPPSKADAIAASVESKLAQRAVEANAKQSNDALHTQAAAEHTTNVLRVILADMVDMSPSEKAWANVLVDTYDAVYSKRTGKPAGSWLAEKGTVSARLSTSNNDMKQRVGKALLEGAGITRWDEAQKMFDVLINSKTHNASTWLREVDRIIFQTKLIDDADKAVITRTYGNMELDEWYALEAKVNGGKATDAEVDLWRQVGDGFTNAHRKWLVEDAFDAAPGELKGVFGRINYAIRTLVNNIQRKLREFGDIPDEVKDVFKRLHFLEDVEEFRARNTGRLADAPTGKSTFILGTIDAKKQYPVTAKLVELDHVIGSHYLNTANEHFEWSDNYDKSLQQRIREAFVNEQEIKRWARPDEFSPHKLVLDFHNLTDGAPIVNDNMQILSGNGRKLMLEYARYKYPASWDAYQKTLKAEAKSWGFSEADFEGMTDPVLVLHLTGEYNPTEFIVDANKSTQAVMSQYETALTHVRYLPGELIERLEFSSQNNISDSLLLAKNQKIIQTILSKLPDSKQYIDMNTGELTPAGIDMLSYAMFAKVFNTDSGAKLLLSLINNPDSNIKNLQNGIMNALPQLAKLSAQIESGTIPADLLPTELIAYVARRVSDLKSSKVKLSEYLGRTDALFGEAQDTPVQMKFVTYIMEHARSSKAITDLLVEYANNALKESAGGKLIDTNVMTTAEDAFTQALDIANKRAVADDLEIGTLGYYAKRAAESPLALLGNETSLLLKNKLAEMLEAVKNKPVLPPQWFNTFTISEAGYPNVIKMLKSMIGDDTVINPLRTQLLSRAWDDLMKSDANFRRLVNANNTPEGLDAQARGLLDKLDDAESQFPGLFQKVEEIPGNEPKQQDIFGNLVTPEMKLEELSKFDKILSEVAEEALAIKKKAIKPVHTKMVIDGVLQRVDQLFIPLDDEMIRLNNQIEGANQPGLFQLAEEAEIPPTRPITEYPVGSQPVHQNIGAGINELNQLDVPTMLDTLMDVLTKRMKASERPKYTINLTEGQQKVLTDYTTIAANNQRLRMATVLEGAKRISKDIMIDYSRKRGFDTMLEMVFPYQFWYTRSTMMWLKRMMAKPNVMAMAYRYRELQRRNEMVGFPSRLGGKSPVYTPWLPKELGDMMWINPGSKFITPEQLFQPFDSISNLNEELATEAQEYILDLLKQKVISQEAATEAIRNKSGTIWADAVQYVRHNTMSDKTDAFTMASMVMNPDPIMNAIYQIGRGTPEKLSPWPLTRLGNAFEAVGGDGVLGIIGAVLSYPEDAARKAAGIPEAGEWGDYYVGFFLSNMAVTSNYSVEDIKKAMISRSGPAYEEAVLQAQQYIALRTPGTAFVKAIRDGHRDAMTLTAAFLMSFFPSGLYPEGEMVLRGLKDEYSAAWDDYARGDKEALERFNNKYPEYETRMMMFQEPTERLRAHLIGFIWDAYGKLPTANKQLAAEQLGSSFQAYFLSDKTRDYEKLDENTLTNWARRLGYQAPSIPATEQAATETVDPMKYYPEDTAATIQSFVDERKTMFPDYYIYQSIYYDLPDSKRGKFLQEYPMLEDYWDWKKEYAANNPVVKSYLEDRANSNNSYDTEFDIEASHDKLMKFDPELLRAVVYHQFTGEPLSQGSMAALNTLFIQAGKPGGDFSIWLHALLGE